MLSIILLACSPEPSSTAREVPEGPASAPQNQTALPLPEETPFTARTRMIPVTLVDERGQPLLVLDVLGVELEVKRLLADRAWVDCTGCRAPLEGWVQRSTLIAPGAEQLRSVPLQDDEAMLLWVAEQEAPELIHGLRAAEGGWLAPPWQGEGGYEGRSCRVQPSGEGWSLSCEGGSEETEAAAEPSEETKPPAAPLAEESP